MCGSNSQQQQLEASQAAFYDQAREQAATTFGEQQAVLKDMLAIYQPILDKGPNQQGFSDEERAAFNTEAIEGTANNYAAAAKTVNEQLASQGGGAIAMPTGPQAQLKAEIAASAAQHLSDQELNIVEQDYATGRTQFNNATNAILTASGQFNPIGYSEAATAAGNAASKTANDIAQADNSWVNAAIGAVGAVGGGLAQNPNIFK